MSMALLAGTYLLRNRRDDARSALEDGLRLAREAKEGFWEAELHRLLGDLALVRGFDHEAEDCFERAIELASKRQERVLELRALASLYRLVRTWTDVKRTRHVRARLAH